MNPTQEQLDAFILRAGFTYGWLQLESWARRMAEQAVIELAQQPAASGEPAEWQGRVGKHGRWRRIDPPPGETMEQRVAYLRSMPVYEIRALYAAPQPAPALVPLTNAQIDAIGRTGHGGSDPQEWFRNAARAIEAAHDIGTPAKEPT